MSSVYIPYAEKIVNEILKLCCLNESQARKLIDLKHLNISADGTKLKVHSNPHGKKVCNCQSQETSHQGTSQCECKRFYNANARDSTMLMKLLGDIPTEIAMSLVITFTKSTHGVLTIRLNCLPIL